MVVSAPERRPHAADDANRTPIQPNLRQCWPYQGADENQVAAILAAEQFYRPADLTNRNPVMAKPLHPNRIAGAFQREKNGIEAARDQGVRDRERHDAARRDQPYGR